MKKVIRQWLIVALLLTFLTVNLYASNVDKLQDEQDEVEESIEENKEQVAALEGSLEAMNAVILDLDSKMTQKQLEIDDYAAKLIAKQLEIDAAKLKLEASLIDQAQYKEETLKRIKVMYEYGDSGYIDVLLEAGSLTDFFTRLEYLTQILKYDDNMFEKLDQIQKDIESQKAQLELEEANLDHLKAEADLQKSQLEDLYIEKTIQMEKIEQNKEMLIAQNEKLEAERIALDKEIELEIEREKERLRKLKKKMMFSDGQFKWPVPGYYSISSPFETRISPISGREEHHNGLDIPAPKGTEVIAAASGIVVTSRWSNSYGNVVVISHGTNNDKNYVTLYAHNSKLLVSQGDAVVKGEVIALVGSTGWSTGNHSHFGVQIDGVWVNPASYFNN